MSAADPIAAAAGAPPEENLRWPRWLDEVDLTLSICPQFVLSGNIRDSHLVPLGGALAPVPLIHALWCRLRERGYEFLLVYDRSIGLSVYPAEARAAAQTALRGHFAAARDFGSSTEPLGVEVENLPALVSAVYRSGACALIVRNASRLLNSASHLSPELLELFAACAESVQSADPRPPRRVNTQPLFNPVFWLLDSMNDLPSWLVVGGERSRVISVALPDHEDRHASARQLAASIAGDLQGAELNAAVNQFAVLADGLTLNEMAAVAHIARDRQVGIADIASAIRYYKVGVTDDPWSKPLLRQQIANGEVEIGKSVKGQAAAVRQTLDILIRSVMGLHGAQASSSSNRPRGVLFFAGPTGVGKTELAKAVSRLIFGDEDACLRFDMSEFSAEHSEARLIGAPPGYVGHDAGGELVNAVRQRPFSVVLFDEIEKAHPRILDKFLQVLEDGRLTDGHGDTVYFSESVLIFTSNLGIVKEGPDGKPIMNVTPGDSYEDVNRKVREEIDYHFRAKLGRPELLNRLGDNIVIFDFIKEEVAKQIFEGVVDNIFARVSRVRGLDLRLADDVRETLLSICTRDLSNGGRGIGNKLETALVNPLARELFATSPAGPKVTVSAIRHNDGKYWIVLE